MSTPAIIITRTDLERLWPVIDQHDTLAAESLASELHRAVVVDAVPADVVTMHSDVVYEDCETRAQRRVRLVFPREADAASGRVSVLAPIGSALLGLRVGQRIEWPLPGRTTRIRVVAVERPQ